MLSFLNFLKIWNIGIYIVIETQSNLYWDRQIWSYRPALVTAMLLSFGTNFLMVLQVLQHWPVSNLDLKPMFLDAFCKLIKCTFHITFYVFSFVVFFAQSFILMSF